ncbi:FliM/FliN family flagellar motor switch protein [Sphingomonas sp. NIBR02145]|uniref:FliM/FliN family flagellar motor switch protein n=1 Tax=Sphingomonas sp. NIBR02145 TaxID=3014784 RepID=UPI0022B33D82|nr:FliM/FliN family flagellar motor switch protein [Sphingomonas sp. NIBR02145]WHU04995.1 FliM/FliN family flagellar motor switch protein [Sphingomonas sp. NIBR02145]
MSIPVTEKTETLPTETKADSTRVSSKLIDNVAVELEAFLGSAPMTVADLTGLATGSVVQLDAQLNMPVELRLNGMAVARGELVAVGDKFGVRLTEITQWPD